MSLQGEKSGYPAGRTYGTPLLSFAVCPWVKTQGDKTGRADGTKSFGIG